MWPLSSTQILIVIDDIVPGDLEKILYIRQDLVVAKEAMERNKREIGNIVST
jgi:hypothetical protein